MVEGNCRKANCCQLVRSARIQVSPMTEVSLMLMTIRETLGELAATSPAPWNMGNLSSIKVNSLHWDQSINFSFMLCVLLHKTNCSVMTLKFLTVVSPSSSRVEKHGQMSVDSCLSNYLNVSIKKSFAFDPFFSVHLRKHFHLKFWLVKAVHVFLLATFRLRERLVRCCV